MAWIHDELKRRMQSARLAKQIPIQVETEDAVVGDAVRQMQATALFATPSVFVESIPLHALDHMQGIVASLHQVDVPQVQLLGSASNENAASVRRETATSGPAARRHREDVHEPTLCPIYEARARQAANTLARFSVFGVAKLHGCQDAHNQRTGKSIQEHAVFPST